MQKAIALCAINEIEAKLKAVEGLGLKIYNANSATLTLTTHSYK